MSSRSEQYRADIDGLRALAVVVVILFHFEVEHFGGGFVGVDVFFVISGFLITRLIHDEASATRRFSFSHFYTRRVRRLFPALFFTVASTFVAACFLFPPESLERLSGAVIHSMLGVSNIYFWTEVGYFDLEAHMKPLLHTWSLGVEEQFYLFWPALLALLSLKLPKWAAPLGLAVLAASSLALNVVFADQRETIFYLTPFRVFELAIGGLMVWVVEFRPKWEFMLEPILVVGLLAVGYAVVTLTPEVTFPSFNALAPCLGTASIIYAGTARYAGTLLRNRMTVGVGLVSYSLYLVHWPIYVFYRYWTFGELTALEQIGLFVASLTAAAAMHRWIEQPFRKAAHSPSSLSPPAFGLVCCGLALLLNCVAANSWGNGGWAWRFPGLKNLLVSAKTVYSPQRPCHYQYDIMNPTKQGTVAVFLEGKEAMFDACFEKHGKAILVVGDSHAADLFSAISQNTDRPFVVAITHGGCRPLPAPENPKGCHFDHVLELAERNKQKIDAVFFTVRGGEFLIDLASGETKWANVDSVADYVEALSRHVNTYWIGPKPEFSEDPDNIHVIVHWETRESIVRPEIEVLDAALKEAFVGNASRSFSYISLLDAIDFRFRSDFIIDGRLTYYNGDHWNVDGEKHFGKRLVRYAPIAAIF